MKEKTWFWPKEPVENVNMSDLLNQPEVLSVQLWWSWTNDFYYFHGQHHQRRDHHHEKEVKCLFFTTTINTTTTTKRRSNVSFSPPHHQRHNHPKPHLWKTIIRRSAWVPANTGMSRGSEAVYGWKYSIYFNQKPLFQFQLNVETRSFFLN